MKKLLLIAIAFSTFASSGLFAHLYNRDDAMSLRYILWKKGLHPRPDDIFLHALLTDQYGKNEIIRGKTKEEIKDLFPDIHEQSVNKYQKIYDKDLTGQDYVWIGESAYIIEFKDGKAERLSIMKG